MIVVSNDDKQVTLQTVKKMSEISDGYHTFGELYRYRMLLQANWLSELETGLRIELKAGRIKQADYDQWDIHRSWRHHDGELCFGKENYFIVMVTLPFGLGQVSNHYKGEFWNLFSRIPERERASEWDGHTPEEAADRMERYLYAGW